jgi:predicted ATP-dependent endonuclease of OLD family
MRATRFRVQNFCNIDDSGWVSLDQVTALVGRNESGKTTLLKALHKFNPATAESYDPMREFPRDRYVQDYVKGGSKGEKWPVCSVAFEIDEELTASIVALLPKGQIPPSEVIATRYYNGLIKLEYVPELVEQPLSPDPVLAGLKEFASSARRLVAPSPDQEEATTGIRNALTQWADQWRDDLKSVIDLRNDAGVKYLTKLKTEAESKSNPQTADLVEAFNEVIIQILDDAKAGSFLPRLSQLIEETLPVVIYFENYGVLDSSIYLPRFIEDLKSNPSNAKVRTINAMFKHVGLDANEIESLGREDANNQSQHKDEVLNKDKRRKDERTIRLNSASIDITKRFSDWWSQRRHTISYAADGEYFRIWVTDDRRPDVKIELESRSKGFQWFFSFYLIFLVESEEGHKDAILLLDEPGLNLHPTAQQELLGFFERLSEKNQLVYTTHSPFLIDGAHIYRVRPVTEDSTGHSRISADTWPKDRETIFPLQAAAGYAMLRGLFHHKKNLLVEGMSDYYYLHALSQQCRLKGLVSLPEDIYIIPCGGTKNVGHLAALFLGQEVRPLILLDGDDAGRVRRDALLKELYLGNDSHIVMLDDVLGKTDSTVEIEDIMGEAVIIQPINAKLSKPLRLTTEDRKAGSLPDQIKKAAKRQQIVLPEGWKVDVALQLVSTWAQQGVTLPDDVLDSAAKLYTTLQARFAAASSMALTC